MIEKFSEKLDAMMNLNFKNQKTTTIKFVKMLHVKDVNRCHKILSVKERKFKEMSGKFLK